MAIACEAMESNPETRNVENGRNLVVVKRRRCVPQLGVAWLTDAHRLQKTKSGYFWFESAAFIAKDETTITTVVTTFIDGKSDLGDEIRLLWLRFASALTWYGIQHTDRQLRLSTSDLRFRALAAQLCSKRRLYLLRHLFEREIIRAKAFWPLLSKLLTNIKRSVIFGYSQRRNTGGLWIVFPVIGCVHGQFWPENELLLPFET